MTSILNGLVGGLIATVVMTVFIEALGDDSPPLTAVFYSEYIGDSNTSPEEYVRHGLVLHLLYGVAAGGIFEVAARAADLGVRDVGIGVLWGSVYGVVLFVVGVFFWMRLVLGLRLRTETVAISLFFHLVYGVVHGAWAGLGVIG